MKVIKNNGSQGWHPDVWGCADIPDEMAEHYHGCGRVVATINIRGEVEGWEYIDAHFEPGPNRTKKKEWADPEMPEAMYFCLRDGRPLPEEEPFRDGGAALAYAWISCWQLGVDHGTAAAALLGVLNA